MWLYRKLPLATSNVSTPKSGLNNVRPVNQRSLTLQWSNKPATWKERNFHWVITDAIFCCFDSRNLNPAFRNSLSVNQADIKPKKNSKERKIGFFNSGQ
jgi:hypothetical protein